MTIRASGSKVRGKPPHRQAFREGFVRQVHCLLALGAAQLDPVALCLWDEPAITGLLVLALRRALESHDAPSWAWRYAVHDDPPVSDHPALGRQRPRVDIELERAQPGPHPRFQFEAKRLYDEPSVSEYLGDDGLGRFLRGRYAAHHEDAGMLGYVQSGLPAQWANKIRQKLESDRSKYDLPPVGPCWEKRRIPPELTESYKSNHLRSLGPITIHHTFLGAN